MINEIEVLVLPFRQHIEILFVKISPLSMSMASLHPRVLPVGVCLFTGNHHFAWHYCKQSTIATEPNLHHVKKTNQGWFSKAKPLEIRTFKPGWNRKVRWVARIVPAVTVWPSWTLHPLCLGRDFGLVFLVDPDCFLLAFRTTETKRRNLPNQRYT